VFREPCLEGRIRRSAGKVAEAYFSKLTYYRNSGSQAHLEGIGTRYCSEPTEYGTEESGLPEVEMEAIEAALNDAMYPVR